MVNESTREAVYSGVKGAMFLYGGLFRGLAEAVGLEKAVELHSKIQEPFGDGLAALLKKRLGSKEVDIKTFSEVYRSTSTMGVENVYMETPSSFVVKGFSCPIYSGLKEAGLDHRIIKMMCEGAGSLIYKAFNRHYPKIEAGVRFRDSPEDCCVEEYRLKK